MSTADTPISGTKPLTRTADDEFIERLSIEIDSWKQDSLISAQQAETLHSRYKVAYARPRQHLAYLIGYLGVILLGIGVIVFFASNWSFIPGWAKLVLIYAAVISANAIGYQLRYAGKTYPGMGRAMLFLGALLYGAAVFLIAQGYHVDAGEPSLLLLWAASALPMAYLTQSRSTMVLCVFLLALALGWQAAFWITGPSSLYAIDLLLTQFGCGIYALANLHSYFESTRVHAGPLKALGLAVILGSLLPLTFTFSSGSGEWHRSVLSELARGTMHYVMSFVLVVLGSVLFCFRYYRARRSAHAENFALLAVYAVTVLMAATAQHFGPMYAFVMNLYMLALIAGALAVGFWNNEPALISMALAFFTLQTACRYFDAFWESTPHEIFFIGAGLALIFGGVALERTRRRVLGNLNSIGA